MSKLILTMAILISFATSQAQVDYRILEQGKARPPKSNLYESFIEGRNSVCKDIQYSGEYALSKYSKVCIYENGYRMKWAKDSICPKIKMKGNGDFCEIS
jgi:hypothetical protein